MDPIQIDFVWEDPQEAKGRELRATWASLRITIDGVPVTQVQDHQDSALRDTIYVPLYPLAEWIATHWWGLFYEYETPRRKVHASYAMRHNFRYAREGFALPALAVLPMGPKICFEWTTADMPAQKVRFLTQGVAYIDTTTVCEKFSSFIREVLQRLTQEGVANTLLEDEWRVIEQVDQEERAFCQAAAILGLDPYSLTDEEQASIIQASQQLPDGLAMDFFAIADSHDLVSQVASLVDGLDKIKNLSGELTGLKELRNHTDKIDPIYTPWDQGYALAKKLREERQFEGRFLKEMNDFSELLRVDCEALQNATLYEASPGRFLDALMDVNANSSPGFLIGKPRKEARHFALCRGLFEYLTLEQHMPVLISATRSERQKRNRAFAAELLAPSTMLQEHIQSTSIDEEEVEDLADAFGVSTYVIRHQIENHQLARLIPQ